jgi:hypothetical protein
MCAFATVFGVMMMDILGANHDVLLVGAQQSTSDQQRVLKDLKRKAEERHQTCSQSHHICDKECKDIQKDKEIEVKKLETTSDPGYNISFDNIDLRQERRHMSVNNQAEDIHWVNHRATFNRVSNNWLSSKPPPDITEIPNIQFLPGLKDHKKHRHNLIVLVSRILVKHLKEFEFLQEVCITHIPHQYTKEMSKKSDQVHYTMYYFEFSCQTQFTSIVVTCYIVRTQTI